MSNLPILFAAVLLPAFAQDTAVLNSQPNGLIVWGKYGLSDCRREFKNQPTTAPIGTVGPKDLILCKAGEVVAFTAGKAPAWTAATFTSGSDIVNLAYPPEVPLKVKVWVLCADAACGAGPLSSAAKTNIMAKLAVANLLFHNQNAGIRLDLSDPNLISDQLSNTAKKTLYEDFTDCNQFPGLVNGIIDKGSINLYLVRSVNGGFGRGQTCWLPNVAALGCGLDAGLIAHEIGHDHYLQHSEYFTELDDKGLKNIMNSLSNQREYLSEGEVFRMHFLKLSVLNRKATDYSTPLIQRPEARNCDPDSSLKPCAPIGTRLWDDP
jgi:hypothetical protein